MRSPSRRPPELVGKIFRGSDVVRVGLLSKDDLRSRHWRQLFRNVYADRKLSCSHRHRCLAAAWYLLPPQAAIAGRSAALLHGANLVRDTDPVEVLTPTSARFGPVTGLKIHVGEVPDEDVQVIRGVRRTTPVRTCRDLALWLDLPDAVAYLDVMLARGLVTNAGLSAYAQRQEGRRGSRRLVRAVALTDTRAESPQESRLRVRLVLAGLPRPESQYVIRKEGQFVGRVDLAWPAQRVAVEYDGQWHGNPRQLHRDRARLNQLVTTDGWVILHITSQRLADDFDGFVAELRAALRTR